MWFQKLPELKSGMYSAYYINFHAYYIKLYFINKESNINISIYFSEIF